MQTSNVKHAEDSMGFEAQVTPHLQALTAVAWHFTHNTAMAQDLLQDTLLKAYRFFHRFEPGTNVWAWLITIMRNLHLSQVRKQARQAAFVGIDHLPGRAAHSIVDLPEVPFLEDLRTVLPYLVTDDVLQALDELPEEYRTAVLLADLLEYSYKDIAARMHCPIGTVMSRLYRGRQMLQSRLHRFALEQGYIRVGDVVSPPAIPGNALQKEMSDT